MRALRGDRGGAEKKITPSPNVRPVEHRARDPSITGPVWDMYPTVAQAIKVVKAGVSPRRIYAILAHGQGRLELAPYGAFEEKLPLEIKEMSSSARRRDHGRQFPASTSMRRRPVSN